MAQFNFMNMADTYGRGQQEKQQEEWNALRMDTQTQANTNAQTEFDEATRQRNTDWAAGATLYGSKNPDAIPALIKEGQRRGVLDKNLNPANVTPEMLAGYHQKFMAERGGQKYTDETVDGRTMQRENLSGKLTSASATPKGPTSPQANYAERQRLVSMYGENSDQVKTFDSYVRAPQYQTVNQVPTQMTPSGNVPLSSLQSEAAAANTVKMAEGEGGRGRVQQPDGSYAPVAGTEAAVKQKEAERKRAGGAFMKSIQSQTVVEDVGRLNEQIKVGDVPFGRMAAIQEGLTPFLQSDGYRNANSLIESVKGNVGIDSLLRIKATGAGLGQVPQSQLDLLSRLLGELDMKQSEEQFTETWHRMGEVYEIIMKQADADLYELDVERPDVAGNNDAALQEARTAIQRGADPEAVKQRLISMGIDPGTL